MDGPLRTIVMRVGCFANDTDASHTLSASEHAPQFTAGKFQSDDRFNRNRWIWIGEPVASKLSKDVRHPRHALEKLILFISHIVDGVIG